MEKLPEGSKSEVQSISFDTKKWTIGDAKDWLRSNDFEGLIVDEIKGAYSFGQYDPELFKSFTVVNKSNGIKFSVGFTKEIKLKKHSSIVSGEIDFDALALYMGMKEVPIEIQNIILELVGNYDINELQSMTHILSEIYYQMDAKNYEIIENIKLVKHDKKQKAKKVKRQVKLLKNIDTEKRLVYGVVVAPNEVDTDNQWYDEENIERACHIFMKHYQESGIDHEFIIQEGMRIVESYIAPSNIMVNKTMIKKGSWVMVHEVKDDEIWNRIKDGDLAGYSFEGIGILVPELPPRS